MSYVQCLASYPQQYKLTHDVSLDSLNDLDNDIALSPDYKSFSGSWTYTGPNHTTSGGHIDNDLHNTTVNANNVRNTQAHGQSTSSWSTTCHDNNACVKDASGCIADYISSRTPAHGGSAATSAACGTEHTENYSSTPPPNCAASSRGSVGRRKEEVFNLIDSEDLSANRRRHCVSARSRSSAANSPEVSRRSVAHAQTTSPTGGDLISGRAQRALVASPDYADGRHSLGESQDASRGTRSTTTVDEELVFTSGQRLSSCRSSPEEDQAPASRCFSRQDSRTSDSSYSDENCRRQSEDGSDCSQRSIRATTRRTPRKGRRPRKLPEIPPSAKATAATLTFMTASGSLKSCSLTQLCALLSEVRDNKEAEFLQRSMSCVDRSLADELSEADPSLKLANDINHHHVPPCGLLPTRSEESSPDSTVEFDQPAYRNHRNRNRHSSGASSGSKTESAGSERDIMSMSTSTVGSQQGDEFKVKAEEGARETAGDEGVMPDSPRRLRQRATEREEALLSCGMQRAGGATNVPDPTTLTREEALRQQARTLCMRRDSFDIATADRRSSVSSSLSLGVDDLDATHRGCHKFIPRHSDELFIEIGDPIAVQVEDDDLWCAGYNLRTTKYGIFPSAYATDLSILEGDDGSMRPIKFILRFLGSVEVSCHRGTEVLAQAINKVALSMRQTLNAKPAPVVLLEINEQGVKMSERKKKKDKEKVSEGSDIPMSPSKRAASIRARLAKIMSKQKDKSLDHFFTLKNISFCGYHPRNERYFAFITKHPLEMRFACHVFLGEHSTKTIAEAVGTAFRQFYSQYMAFVHPTEDIYLE